MFIKKESVNEVVLKAQEKFKNAKISVNSKVMERFENALSEIARNQSYEEGKTINERDLIKLTNEAGLVLNNAISDKGNIKKTVDDLMILTDYLYAMTMQRLGSPDIPVSFGTEMKNSIVRFAVSTESNKNLNHSYHFNDSVYEKQRGMDADVLKDQIDVSLSAVENGNPSPSQVQTLVAEYQALQKRQNNHGFFWRLFHSTENANRNELLSNMESALKYVLGADVDIMKSSPLLLAEKVLKQNMEQEVSVAFADDGMAQRIGASAEAFAGSDVNEKDITQQLREKLIKEFDVQTVKKVQAPENEASKSLNKESVV